MYLRRGYKEKRTCKIEADNGDILVYDEMEKPVACQQEKINYNGQHFITKSNTEVEMTFEKATINDIKELTTLRIAYLQEDGGDMDQEVLQTIEVDLPDYFAGHLNNDITAYIARTEVEVVSCAFLLVMEKPMSPAFVTGKTGTVLNVYTRPKYRHKGYAKRLMNMLLKDASNMNLSFIELKATEDGDISCSIKKIDAI